MSNIQARPLNKKEMFLPVRYAWWRVWYHRHYRFNTSDVYDGNAPIAKILT